MLWKILSERLINIGSYNYSVSAFRHIRNKEYSVFFLHIDSDGDQKSELLTTEHFSLQSQFRMTTQEYLRGRLRNPDSLKNHSDSWDTELTETFLARRLESLRSVEMKRAFKEEIDRHRKYNLTDAGYGKCKVLNDFVKQFGMTSVTVFPAMTRRTDRLVLLVVVPCEDGYRVLFSTRIDD
ncbi:hypothetical protein KIN20_008279 [Parelaphostrongylus tenuis]|uniref:Uncharacterized protein n=1 Tax=Parelaphostrongylus tenuis TaxID=148309 RepID=A0AAD5M7R8_PARTN|nr:hypothetical protein KIN20_008279 [Parelaphostrongylus tenuis]